MKSRVQMFFQVHISEIRRKVNQQIKQKYLKSFDQNYKDISLRFVQLTIGWKDASTNQ